MPDYLRIGCALPFGWSHSFPCAGTAACSPLKSRASNISQNGDYRLPPAEGTEAYIQGFLIAQEHVRHHDILRKSLERERQSFATNWCSVCRAVLAPANVVWSQSSSLYPPFWLFLSSSSLDIIKASLYYKTTQQVQQWGSLTYTAERFSHDQPTLTTDTFPSVPLLPLCSRLLSEKTVGSLLSCGLPYVSMYLF